MFIVTLAVALITLVNIWTSLSHSTSSGVIGTETIRAMEMEEASLRSSNALSQSVSFSKSAESQQQQQQQQQQPVELQDLGDPRGVMVSRKPAAVRVPGSTGTSTLPPVQGWPYRGDVKPPRMTPSTDRQLYESLDDTFGRHKLISRRHRCPLITPPSTQYFPHLRLPIIHSPCGT
jgi:hypothetical protein